MASGPPPTDVEQEAACSICLEYLKDAVTVDCGHNYCRGCITMHCERQEELEEDLECPICRARVQKGNFRPNWQLANIVEQIKRLQLNPEREGMCEKHKEKLHLFCKEDEELVCWKCKDSREHELHTVFPKEKAAQEYKDLIHHRLEILKKERENILAWKANTERESQDLLKQTEGGREKTVAKFRQLHQFLEEQEQLLFAQMDEVEKEIARKQEEHQVRLSEELSSLESLIREMEEKCQQPARELLQDVKSTLQRTVEMAMEKPLDGRSQSEKETFENPVAFPPDLKWRIWDCCDINPCLERVMEQFKDALLLGLQLQKANVTLDPDTAHPWLILSEGHKSVRLGESSQDLPDNPERFIHEPFVLGREGFLAGRHFWEVSVGSEERWFLGVVRKSVRRKGLTNFSSEDGIWAVGRWGGEFKACISPHYPCVSLSGNLNRIWVSLNCDEGQVAFYNAERGTLLYTFSGNSFSGETLLPFFAVADKGHLRISP